VCDLETSRMGAPYIYDISRLRVNNDNEWIFRTRNETFDLSREAVNFLISSVTVSLLCVFFLGNSRASEF